MAKPPMLGAKIRRLRKGRGLAQMRLAEMLGISASYLNMIEHNDRPLTVPLLLKLSEHLDVDLQAFSEGEEARLKRDLQEVFSEPLFTDLQPSALELDDLVNNGPEFCQGFLRLYRANRSAREDMDALNDRIASSPYLLASSHEVRTLLTSVRSFSEILHDNVDLAVEERQQLLSIVVEGAEKLTHQVVELLAFVTGDGMQGLMGNRASADEVADFAETQDDFFDDLDRRAEELREELGLGAQGLYPALISYLTDPLGIDVVPYADGQDAPVTDGDGAILSLQEGLAPEDIRFVLAREIIRHAAALEIETQIEVAGLGSDTVRRLCHDYLVDYGAAALLMPYRAFLARAQRERYDIEQLGRAFEVSREQVCQRLTSLRRPGDEGARFHFLRIDRAGNISQRVSGSGLPIPRFGGICPRWNIHAVHGHEGLMNTQILNLVDGSNYFCIAFASRVSGLRHGQPETHHALAIGCRLEAAHQLIYADGLDLANSDVFTPGGITCQLCEREDCLQRAFPSLVLIGQQGDEGATPSA